MRQSSNFDECSETSSVQDCNLLRPKEYLSNQETLDFCSKHFGYCTKVPIEEFLQAIDDEFSRNLTTKVQNEDNVQEVMNDFFAELTTQLSSDNQFISFSILELKTKGKGLQLYIT